MCQDQEVFITEPVPPQRLEVLPSRFFRRSRELEGEFGNRALARPELRFRSLFFDRIRERVISGDLTEILPVSLGSVMAVVRLGDDRRGHLPLLTAQPRIRMHN